MLVIVLSYVLLFTTKIHMIQVPDKAQQGDQKQQLREILAQKSISELLKIYLLALYERTHLCSIVFCNKKPNYLTKYMGTLSVLLLYVFHLSFTS